MCKVFQPLVWACLVWLTLSHTSYADVIININQVGANVVATGSGTVDRTTLSPYPLVLSNSARLTGNNFLGGDEVILGSTSTTNVDALSNGVAGNHNFKSTAATIAASSATGDMIGVANALIFVPDNYVSNTPLSGTAQWDNQTIASLGLIEGSYEWTWQGGAQKLTLNISSAAAVPEPSSVALFGAIALGAVRVRRRKRKLGTDFPVH